VKTKSYAKGKPMMKIKMLSITMIFILSSILIACGADPASEEVEGDSDALPPIAVVRAQEALAAELGIDVEDVTIESYQRMDWSDSCLGLGGAAESCLAEIYPGWQVMLLVNDEGTYEVRTDEMGEIIRIRE
jgi:hypothetical protein